MAVIAICFCIAIVRALGDMEQAKEVLKANEVADKVVSRHAKRTLNQDQYVRLKGARVGAHNIPTKTEEILNYTRSLLVVTPLTGTSKPHQRRKIQQNANAGTEVKVFWPLYKRTRRYIIRTETPKNVPRKVLERKGSASVHSRHTERNFANKKMKLMRRKFRNDSNDPYLDHANHVNNEDNEMLQKIPTQLNDGTGSTDHNQYALPRKNIINGKEMKINDSVVWYSEEILRDRNLLKQLVQKVRTEYPELIANYKSLSIGETRTNQKLNNRITQFLRMPSRFLLRYKMEKYPTRHKKTLEKDEHNSTENFPNVTGVQVDDKSKARVKDSSVRSTAKVETRENARATGLERRKRSRRDTRWTADQASVKAAKLDVHSSFLKDRELPLSLASSSLSDLKNQIVTTDRAEEKLVDSVAKNKISIDFVDAEKEKERTILKQSLVLTNDGASSRLPVYHKALRKDSPWNFVNYSTSAGGAFFSQPSDVSLDRYRASKRDELAFGRILRRSRCIRRRNRQAVGTNTKGTTRNEYKTTTVATQSPRINKTDKPTSLENQSPRIDNTNKPTSVVIQSPRIDNTNKPTSLETQSQKIYNTDMPTTVATQSPRINIGNHTDKPTSLGTQSPKIHKTYKPTTVATRGPKIHKTDKPTTVAIQSPKIHNTDKPMSLETQSQKIHIADKPTTVAIQSPKIHNTDKPMSLETQSQKIHNTDKPTTVATQSPRTDNTDKPTSLENQRTRITNADKPTSLENQSQKIDNRNKPSSVVTQGQEIDNTDKPTSVVTQSPRIDNTDKPTSLENQSPRIDNTDKPTSLETQGQEIDNTDKPMSLETQGQEIDNTDKRTSLETQSPRIDNTDKPTSQETQGPEIDNTDKPTSLEDQSPKINKTDKPTSLENQSPRIDNTDKPTSLENQSPKINKTDKPTSLENQSPRIDNTEKPTSLENQSPRIDNMDKPTFLENQSPKINKTDKPTSLETQSPKINNKDKPTSLDNQSPRIDNKDKPTSLETQSPKIHNTEKPTSLENQGQETDQAENYTSVGSQEKNESVSPQVLKLPTFEQMAQDFQDWFKIHFNTDQQKEYDGTLNETGHRKKPHHKVNYSDEEEEDRFHDFRVALPAEARPTVRVKAKADEESSDPNVFLLVAIGFTVFVQAIVATMLIIRYRVKLEERLNKGKNTTQPKVEQTEKTPLVQPATSPPKTEKSPSGKPKKTPLVRPATKPRK